MHRGHKGSGEAVALSHLSTPLKVVPRWHTVYRAWSDQTQLTAAIECSRSGRGVIAIVCAGIWGLTRCRRLQLE
jgi:hypothetical protein